MRSKWLRRFQGPLDVVGIAEGMNSARHNARRLADDAKLLLNGGRYPSAASLAVLSIEESGKMKVLRHLAMAPNDDVRRRVWRDYRSHRSKNTMWIVPELVAKGACDLEAFRLATDPKAEHTALLDQIKQIGFYTDCYGTGEWCEPHEVVDEALAQSLVGIADILAKTDTVTSKEVELWVEHMGPVYGAQLDLMKAALEKWFAAMREQGLWKEGSIPVESFIYGHDPGPRGTKPE